MLVCQVKGRARNGQRHHGCCEGDAGPSSTLLGEQDASNAPASDNDQQYRCELQKEFGDLDGNVSELDETCDPLVEECCLKLYTEELGVMLVEDWVQVAFYGRQINAIIFDARVIAHHRHGNERKG